MSDLEGKGVKALVVCGPSGVGKGTLLDMLKKDMPGVFQPTVSHTTRAPRKGEENGVHYHFVTREAFTADIEAGKFIEYAEVHGNLYGTSIAAVEAVSNSGRVCILEVDIQGAESIRKTELNPYFLFVSPPSLEELESRLSARGSESEETLKRRLSTAKKEMEYLKSGASFHYVLHNDDLHRAYHQLRAKLFEFYPHLVGTVSSTSIYPSEGVKGGKEESVVVTIQQDQKEKPEVAGLKPLVICGPSGVGKGTLLDMLSQDFPDLFKRTVSHTTRAPRQGEEHGVHYYFVTKEEFLNDVKEGKFIEHAEVHGNFYGTSLDTVEKVTASGQICILEVDVQGAESLRKTRLQPYFFFISPPSFEELKARISGRGSETEATLQRRLDTAKRELDYFQSGAQFHYELKNDNLHSSYHSLRTKLTQLYPHLEEKYPSSIHPSSTPTPPTASSQSSASSSTSTDSNSSSESVSEQVNSLTISSGS